MYDPSDPCLYGDSAACQLSCYQSHHSPGACLGYRCTCQPGLMYPTGPQRPPRDGRARYMSEEPREVPCMMGGDQRCSQFCVDNTGYGGQCQGMACKCFAMNGP
ncbi:uncharacterized protein LOC144142998 [Haemaphysalis longicornis]